ncbi:MAG: Rieske 2Fe-2S domain-containing protein [Methylotenera sp.]|nr:Rieske 2Fe-2S domain-containing protein [Methylotenera sp.]MDO9232934.1 Rieske 2Fe-2S domain-containing protein [Methylotenera sp.]MDO9388841.1 Rieske 2Fe-2S domain-containing protein [Methylotenera sp.]MDP2102242.1 Rieske 2Fe-2S domain-containing protein [Methylotenera sp.]MDP2281202.1 Rieske 2Fe-2S domain-containing protein [Methylotenera sp.]
MHNADSEQGLIAIDSADLVDGGKGIRFALPALGEFVTGFVVRFQGKPYAYVNRCAHISVELDWNEGDFFTAQQDFLICSTHGAHYRPDNGFCVMGPCKGKSLKPIKVIEQNQKIIINVTSVSE